MLHFEYTDNKRVKHRLSVGDTIWYSRLKQRSLPVELKTDLTKLNDRQSMPERVVVFSPKYGTFNARTDALYCREKDVNRAIKDPACGEVFEQKVDQFVSKLSEDELDFVEALAAKSEQRQDATPQVLELALRNYLRSEFEASRKAWWRS